MIISRVKTIISILQICFLPVLSSTSVADGIKLDLEKAIKLASEQNLELKAKREELGIAQGRLIRSNLFLQHNPELEGDIANRRLLNPEPGFNKNLPVGGVSLSQEFELGGQPGHRLAAARRNMEKVKFEISNLERKVRFRVTEVFLGLLSIQKKIQQAKQIVDLRTRLFEASRTRLSLGDIPEGQLIIAEFELKRARSDLITLQREYEAMLLRLKANLVLERNVKIDLTGKLARTPFPVSLGKLLDTALAKRPDLAALDEAKKIAEAEKQLTEAERIPNVRFGVFYEKDEKDNIVGGRLSIPIPVFDRRRAELRQALARKSIANINYLNLRQMIEKEVETTFKQFKLNENDLSLYPEGTMKRFDENLELNQKAYQEGQIALSEAILFQNQVIEARLKFIDALTNYNLSLAELKFRAGIE
ncbi:MAG: TolC family protein [Candidatus Binatia bacterium]